MSTQLCRLAVLTVRGPGCRLPWRIDSGQVMPTTTGRCGASRSRAYSLDSLSPGPGRPSLGHSNQQPRVEGVSASSALTHRNLSAVAVQGQRRPLCQHDYLDIGDIEENLSRAKACKFVTHFIVEPAVAERVAKHLGPDLDDPKTIIFECNPGPGVLTKTLLNAGAQRVVALEGNKSFLHNLQVLEGRLDGRLDVVNCDFFKLNPIGTGLVQPPTMFSDKLFTNLGISEARWDDDIPVKVVGVLPSRNERSKLLKLVYALLERLSIYRYGRVELNLFLSETEYRKLTSQPGDMLRYGAYSVFWQMACDITLLHKEPYQSFVSSKPGHSVGKAKLPNDQMCLVRLRPRVDLFSSLSPSNASTLLFMVKQCLAKRKVKLIDRLNQWAPDSGSNILAEMGLSQDILTGNVYPEEYLRLFQLMEQSQEFMQSWLYDEILENTLREGWV